MPRWLYKMVLRLFPVAALGVSACGDGSTAPRVQPTGREPITKPAAPERASFICLNRTCATKGGLFHVPAADVPEGVNEGTSPLKCPYCGQNTAVPAVQCPHCKKWTHKLIPNCLWCNKPIK